MPNTESVAETVEIQVGLGLSFHVSSEIFWKAQKAANDTRLVHYIGVTPQNSEVIGCDRETLEDMGCDSIVFVAPEYRSPMQQFGDFVMEGQ